jgi:hypothetical protein
VLGDREHVVSETAVRLRDASFVLWLLAFALSRFESVLSDDDVRIGVVLVVLSACERPVCYSCIVLLDCEDRFGDTCVVVSGVARRFEVPYVVASDCER